MQVEVAKNSGGYLTDRVTTNASWVCPRKGEVIKIEGKNWTVSQLYHDFDDDSLIIYVEG